MIPAFKFRLWGSQGQMEKKQRTPTYFCFTGGQWWQHWQWHWAPTAPVSEENSRLLELRNTNVVTQSHDLFCPLHSRIKGRQSLCEVPHPTWRKVAKKQEIATNAWRSPTNQATQDTWHTKSEDRHRPLRTRLSWGLDLMLTEKLTFCGLLCLKLKTTLPKKQK